MKERLKPLHPFAAVYADSLILFIASISTTVGVFSPVPSVLLFCLHAVTAECYLLTRFTVMRCILYSLIGIIVYYLNQQLPTSPIENVANFVEYVR
jgi:hypothetical protein